QHVGAEIGEELTAQRAAFVGQVENAVVRQHVRPQTPAYSAAMRGTRSRTRGTSCTCATVWPADQTSFHRRGDAPDTPAALASSEPTSFVSRPAASTDGLSRFVSRPVNARDSTMSSSDDETSISL